MPNTSLPDSMIHQLENLSLEQLLEVKAKVDALIANKSVVPRLSVDSDLSRDIGSYVLIDRRVNLPQIKTISIWDWETVRLSSKSQRASYTDKVQTLLYKAYDITPLTQELSEKVADESVSNAISLVEKWLEEDSDYDEKNYPEIELALQENKLYL